jgi:hypothetical protein
MAGAIAKRGVQAGVVVPATNTSPGCSVPKSSGPCSTRAVAVIKGLALADGKALDDGSGLIY